MLGSPRSKQEQIGRDWFADSALGCSADAYFQYLTDCGYAVVTINGYLGSVAHFAHWLGQQQPRVVDIGEELICHFLDRHLPRCRCARHCRRARTEARAALGHLLQILRTNGQCAPKISMVPSVIAAELEDFDRYLAEARGLAPVTRAVRVRHLRDFLRDSFGSGPVQLSSLEPAEISHFIEHYTAGWAPASVKQACISLRSYFAFRRTRGEQTTTLIAALPRVAQWRLAGLPQMLSQDEINRLLQAFDRNTAMGKRIDVLPLPHATGRAVAAYLHYGRPHTTRREIFVRHRPPINGPADPDIVRNAVRNAAKRCGLQHRIRGTHILRHTLAGRLVQRPARFKEIADLLRHRNLDTTTIYAKVDLHALARVALPWPGAGWQS